MKLTLLTPVKSLSKAYLKQSVKREQIDLLKVALVRLFERIREGESEEHLKNIIADFLKDTWYKPAFEINTSGKADLVIHNGKSSSDPVGVIIEVKRPSNTAEMISSDRPNVKALHELLHYYMQERFLRDNKEIRRLVICNIYEWYIFDAVDFERFFFSNPKFVKSYRDWREGTLPGMGTDWFYQEIARPFIEEKLAELPCTCFNLKEYERIVRGKKTLGRGVSSEDGSDKKLITLYKLLSPPHLLKLPFANDSNSLNREFYVELLYIIGLEEVREKGKKLIRRTAAGARHDGSLLENTISVLTSQRVLENLDHPEQFGATDEERLFSIGLELCITWLDRILFLKLLEGRLIAHHRGDRNHAFLNSHRIGGFDDLQELFFEVLAVRSDDRGAEVRKRYGTIPYLNSSLFEPGDLERKTVHISSLKERRELPVHGATVLKDSHGKRLGGSKELLPYLFEFLDAYDFAAEGNAEIQEENKTIISAAVLGLIFEKINGYKDGSFFTPGFITMYMCRESIRRAVVAKFRNSGIPGLESAADFADLKDRLDPTDRELRRKANDVINSLKLCDPAVGSGHFLVSALNEIIAIKSELGILSYRGSGDRVKEYRLSVEQDELIVIDKDDDHLFEYILNRNNRPDEDRQRLQETLFHEKQAIIENCLFGVDINPKSVSICRLRLWIELLKHAYYTDESGYAELETLPNIDINIKCGNSLVSRYAIRGEANVYATERYKLKALVDRYRDKVRFYKQAPANKAILRKEIAGLKEQLQNFAVPTDPDLIALRKMKNGLDQLTLGMVSDEVEQYRSLVAQEAELKRRVEEKQRTVYGNAFEWRFEFPEVLDDNGEFAGFDVVIGNPPYIRADDEQIQELRRQIMTSGQFETLWEKWDLFVPFLELGHKILRDNGMEAMIVSDGYCHAKYAQKSQEWFLRNSRVIAIDFIGSLDVFDEASVHNVICFFQQGDGTGNRPARRLHEGEFGAIRLLAANEQQHLTHRAFFPEEAATAVFSVPTVPLADVCYISVGMVVHADEREARGAFELADLISGAQDELHPKPFVEGKHLARWLPVSRRWLEWGSGRAPALFRRPTFPELYEVAEKLLIHRVSGRDIHVSYDDQRLLCNHTALVCLPWPSLAGVRNKSLQKSARYADEKSRPDLPSRETLEVTGGRFAVKYLLAVMHSSVARNFLQAHRRSNTDLYPDDWKKLPIPDVPAEQQAPIITLVDKILVVRQADPKGDISALETDLDRLVSALYGLTDEEIAVVEGRK